MRQLMLSLTALLVLCTNVIGVQTTVPAVSTPRICTLPGCAMPAVSAGTPSSENRTLGTFHPVGISGTERRPIMAVSPSPSKPTKTHYPDPLKLSTTHRVKGEASWGPFGGHVVTRLPRGTSITIIGPKGRWSGLSWGYGPAKWTGRIADLDKEVFRDVCGDPYILGVCDVTLIWR